MQLALRGISKKFGTQLVLNDLSADFGTLHTLALIGPSGGGKSTLLRIVAGLEMPDTGEVVVDGSPIDFSEEKALRAHRMRLGVVFQAYNLFPHLTALENVTLPLTEVH